MKRKINFDLLRFICAFWVVLLHVSGSYWNCGDPNNNYFVAMTFYNGISRSAVPLFVMISGMVMIPKDVPAKSLVKRILRLVGCFYGWSFFFAFQGIAFKLICNNPLTSQDIFNSLQRLIFGHYHQWFILMIIGLYLILPFVKKLCTEKSLMIYFIILWIVNTFITTLLPVQGITTKLQLSFIVGYVGYFILGYYLSQNHISKILRVCLYVSSIIGAAYTVFKTIIDTRNTGTFIETHYNPFTWNVFIMAVGVFVFFQYEIKTEKTIYTKLASTSLFVYMLHPFFIEKLNMIGITIIKGNPWWTVPVMSIVIFVTCVTITLAIFKLKNHIIEKVRTYDKNN